MGFKIPDHSAAGPVEKRWFAGLMAFSLAAALVFYARVAFVLWGREEIKRRVAAAGKDELKVGAATEFLEQVRSGEMIGWALLMLCCMGFVICAGMWIRTLRIRLRSGEKR
jgi:hypothetical protein